MKKYILIILMSIISINVKAKEIIIPYEEYSDNMTIYGECIQNGTPSPDNPIEIDCIEKIKIEIEPNVYKYINMKGNFLGSLPNGAKDELKIVDGKATITKSVRKIIFNGSETIIKTTTAQTTLGYFFNIDNNITNAFIDNLKDDFMLCNYFKQVRNHVPLIENGYFCKSSTIGRFVFGLQLENVENFKTWLSTHNTIVYYELETPTTIDTELDYSDEKGYIIHKLRDIKNEYIGSLPQQYEWIETIGLIIFLFMFGFNIWRIIKW